MTLNIVGRHLRMRVNGPGAGQLDLKLDTQLQQGRGLSLASRRMTSTLEDEGAAAARKDLRALLDRLQSAGADVVGFGELVRERDPAAVGDWPDTFGRMRIRIDVAVRVRPSGRLP